MNDKAMNTEPVILYVEDDANSREIVRLLLVDALGWTHVTVFEDSSDFTERVLALSPMPDICLLDIHIQPHNGFEMLKMLRAIKAFDHVPVVALTASVMNEEVHELKKAGFSGVIAKPINQDNFIDLIRRFLHGEQLWRVIE